MFSIWDVLSKIIVAWISAGISFICIRILDIKPEHNERCQSQWGETVSLNVNFLLGEGVILSFPSDKLIACFYKLSEKLFLLEDKTRSMLVNADTSMSIVRILILESSKMFKYICFLYVNPASSVFTKDSKCFYVHLLYVTGTSS